MAPADPKKLSPGITIIRHIIGKRIVRGRAEYHVAWVGHGGEAPTCQALSDIPPGSRYLANGFNRRLRQEAQQQPAGAAANVAHSYVGKEVVKDLSHGAVFAGYVNEYYPSETSGDGMSPGLFHIEYGGGDKEDMEAEEVNPAIALAASRRSDD